MYKETLTLSISMLVQAPPHTDLTHGDRTQGFKLYLQTAGASALFDAIDSLATLAQSHICSTVSHKQAHTIDYISSLAPHRFTTSEA